jgi:hypothetical protein
MEAPRDLRIWGWFDWRFYNKTRNSQIYLVCSRECFFDGCEDRIFVEVMGFRGIQLELK